MIKLDNGVPDPPFAAVLPFRSLIDEQCDRDSGLLQTLTLRCDECDRHGAAKDGQWHIVSGLTYCDACFNAEAHT